MPGHTTVALAHVECGSGIPVLALHGWTPDHRLMLGCLEPVFDQRCGYRRLYPDLPGMGATPAPATINSADHVLDAVQDFVEDHIGQDRFLVVGESYGGYLARALAASRPEQVLGLALICPLGTAVESADRIVPDQQVLRADPDLLRTLDEALAESFSMISVVQTPTTVRRFRDEVQPGLEAADTEALARIAQRWTLSTDPEAGAPYAGPTLILTGRQDHCVGYVDQFALLEHYPRASFVVLDVAGHNLQIEQPGLFEALLLEWLDRVAAES